MYKLTGFFITCPHCLNNTRIASKNITGKTTVNELPYFERGDCEHCKGAIYITVDVRVVSTDKATKESSNV